MQNTAKEQEQGDGKRRFQLWIRPSVLAMAEELYEKDNCASRSEFIEKAVIFYSGFLTSRRESDYLPTVVTSTLKSIVAESDNRTCRMLFKIAVELSMALNVIAASHHISPESMDRLRGECVREVKRLNGSIRMEDAARWQEE